MRIAAALLLLLTAACSSASPVSNPRAETPCARAEVERTRAESERAGGYLVRARETLAAARARCPGLDVAAAARAIDDELALPPAREVSADDRRKAALLYRDAVRLRLLGNHREAIRRFERSYAASPHPFTQLQIAEAHAALAQPIEARRSVARALFLAESRAGTRLAPLLAAGHGGAIASVALSPDGRTLYSGGDDGLVIAWDMSSGRERWRTPLSRRHKVFGVALSPGGDRLVAVCDDRVHIVDAGTGALVERRARGDVAASRGWFIDDQRVAVGMADGTIAVWRDGAAITTLPAPEHTPVTAFATNTARTRVAVGWSNGHVGVFDAVDARVRWTRPVDRPVRAVAISPEGDRVYAALWGGRIAVLDADGAEVGSITGDPYGVYALALFDDGRQLAVGAHERSLRVFDVATGDMTHEVPQRSSVRAIAALEHGEVAGIGDGAGELSAVNMVTGNVVRPMTRGGTLTFGVLFHPRRPEMALRLDDGSVMLWNLETGAPRHLRAADNQVWSAAYAPDGERLATVSQQGEILVWRTATGELVRRLGHGAQEILAVAWSADGDTLYTGDEAGNLALWDPHRGVERATIPAHDNWLLTIDVAPDGKTLATGSLDGKAAIVDLTSRAVTRRLAHYREVHAVRYTPDGARLVTAGFDGNIRVWNLARGELAHQLDTETTLKDLALGPDGVAYAAGGDRRIHAMAIADGSPRRGFGEHDAWVLSVAVHPTLPLVVSGAFDRTTRLWHKDTGALLGSITIDAQGAWVIATPDARVETSAADGRTHLLSWRAGDYQLPSWVGWQRGATPGLLAAIVRAL